MVLLAQALSNLIDNALKYAPEHGAIEVAVRRRATARRRSACRRRSGHRRGEESQCRSGFFAATASRGTPGVGLGLSLVQAVAKLHGGSLELSDRHPGLAVVLAWPGDAHAARALASTAP